jgi:site-specific DNA recombinase
MNRDGPVLRCAIYTRVSTEHGLEQEFNSLDNQREAAEAYIKSQAHEGWHCSPARYDDGGFSGGSVDRPALQDLLTAIQARRIDVVVVYKVDRLTRSLADFAKLVELFDQHGVSFVSVTQAFNTTTSMGRLTLNVLLSFAQFEREVTGERIRGKIAASKRKGIWMGGVVPLGYRIEKRKLLVDEPERRTVRLIFERYLAVGSLPALQRDLRERGIVSRTRMLSSGRVVGGVAMTNGPLAHLLRNRVYLGEINHHGKSHPGEHEPIIPTDLFEAVQAKLAGNLTARRHAYSQSEALLIGRLFDDRGNHLTPSYAVKKGLRYRYYVSSVLAQGRREEAGSVARVAASDIEATVIAALRAYDSDPDSTDRDLIQRSLERVTIHKDQIEIVRVGDDQNPIRSTGRLRPSGASAS